MSAMIKLWAAAGYDCQLAMEDTAVFSTVTDAMLIRDGKSMPVLLSNRPLHR